MRELTRNIKTGKHGNCPVVVDARVQAGPERIT
jgi:hypothetical protein